MAHEEIMQSRKFRYLITTAGGTAGAGGAVGAGCAGRAVGTGGTGGAAGVGSTGG